MQVAMYKIIRYETHGKKKTAQKTEENKIKITLQNYLCMPYK